MSVLIRLTKLHIVDDQTDTTRFTGHFIFTNLEDILMNET